MVGGDLTFPFGTKEKVCIGSICSGFRGEREKETELEMPRINDTTDD